MLAGHRLTLAAPPVCNNPCSFGIPLRLSGPSPSYSPQPGTGQNCHELHRGPLHSSAVHSGMGQGRAAFVMHPVILIPYHSPALSLSLTPDHITGCCHTSSGGGRVGFGDEAVAAACLIQPRCFRCGVRSRQGSESAVVKQDLIGCSRRAPRN